MVMSVYPRPETSYKNNERSRRDVMETMKGAWNEVVRTLSDAGDAVVNVFKPTEKSVLDKVADEVKGLTQ